MGLQQDAEKSGGQNAPQIPAGLADVEIKKLIHANRDGERFVSQKGDPQMMVVYADDNGGEAADMFTLSDTAGWALAKVMEAAGMNLAKLDAAGVAYHHFANEEWAAKALVGKRLRIQIAWGVGKNGKPRATITPIRREAVPPATGTPAARTPGNNAPPTIPF